MLLWQGSCIVHNEFKAELVQLKNEHPDAVVLVHPESPDSVVELADVVGSTSKFGATKDMDASTFIVATDLGILHEMQKQSQTNDFWQLLRRARVQHAKAVPFVHGWR